MRERRWLDLVKDYGCDISYHPGKANVVANALSMKNAVIAHLSVQRSLQAEIRRFELTVYARGDVPSLSTLTVQSTFRDRIRAGQASDEQLQMWRQRDESKGRRLYTVVDDIVRYHDRLWVPSSDSLRADILSEATAPCTLSTERTDGESKRVIQILEDLLRAWLIDFQGRLEPKLPLVEFTYNNNYQASIGIAPYDALCGRKCRFPLYCDVVGEKAELGLDIVSQTVELVVKI
ncbi:uncharacterized protein [Primulina huaijiensis]|uniref:uncharacterized protein n=1 Tax=Primulina huaijiensis TaxID=1492673 RepID=UPI003CC74CCD